MHLLVIKQNLDPMANEIFVWIIYPRSSPQNELRSAITQVNGVNRLWPLMGVKINSPAEARLSYKCAQGDV